MSFTRLRYHIVFATKYRARWISPAVEEVLYPVLGKVINDIGGQSIRINGVEDHVHLVCALPPSLCIDDSIRAMKSQSTCAIRRHFEHLSFFKWQRGFGCFTLNPVDMRGILAYVENQKQHHRRRDELQAMWERVEAR
ncbi:IS200/IS605 family transposase [Bradymonas sediminis]|uniref:IS200/IS605 family transposase n=1 Tax=Bradymonas sediminis TaxID=1548548 RepID=A0A2Z4FMZ7_9DELT|nr:IS200/IS605 family transposase [Bradymonas sediminis]AWV90048.1 IS200/IS605 family transposase [Bradymonas sediminis]TDP75993.1 REP element-mobilizing transposase RayT [Bradymonas sediminis]